MRKNKYKGKTAPVNVTFTEGYQERFTLAILKIYEKHLRKEAENQNKVS